MPPLFPTKILFPTKKIKNNKLRDIYIHNWVYNTDLVIVWGNWDLLDKFCRNILPEDKYIEFSSNQGKPDNYTKGRQYRFKGGGSLIWMPIWDTMTLLHEVVHYAQWIADQRSIPMVSETDEVFAYLIENTYKRICEIYLKK